MCGQQHRGTLTQIGAQTLEYIYTAEDERIATYDGGTWTWSIRDLQAHPLREYTSTDSGSGAFPEHGIRVGESHYGSRIRQGRPAGQLRVTQMTRATV